MKLPCTSLYQSRNLSTGRISWDVSLCFSDTVFCSDTVHWSVCSFQCMRQIRCWWGSLSDPVADHKSDYSNYCLPHSVDRDWDWPITKWSSTCKAMWFLLELLKLTISVDTSGIPDNRPGRSGRGPRVSHQLWPADSRQVTSNPWVYSGFCVYSQRVCHFSFKSCYFRG